jgi:hypothetical protein
MKHLITFCEEKNFENTAFNSSKLQSINLENQTDDQFNKGLIPSEYDLKKTPLIINNFLNLPGIYELKMGGAAITNAYKKRQRISVPIEAKELRSLKLPKREDEAVIILGARFSDINREDPKTKKKEKWKGVSFYYIDTNLYINSDDVITISGLPIVTASIENKTLSIFQKLPGWYTLETGTTRSTKGGDLDIIKNIKFVDNFNLETSIGGEPPKT